MFKVRYQPKPRSPWVDVPQLSEVFTIQKSQLECDRGKPVLIGFSGSHPQTRVVLGAGCKIEVSEIDDDRDVKGGQ